MIHLTKGKEPQVLVDNAASWTATLKAHELQGTTPTKTEKSRYNHDGIKVALLAETSGKCAYCESKFEHITYGDIEHIVPKKLDAEYSFKWSNLTIACDTCNTNKGSHEDIVDPYGVDPETRFMFSGPVILPLPSDTNAILTERFLKLNRPRLIERRSERIKRLHDIIVLALGHGNPKVRDAILTDLQTSEVEANQEFAATARSYINSVKERFLT